MFLSGGERGGGDVKRRREITGENKTIIIVFTMFAFFHLKLQIRLRAKVSPYKGFKLCVARDYHRVLGKEEKQFSE